MSVAWNEAHPPELPPRRLSDQLRLYLRGTWAAVTLGALFLLFLPLGAIDAGAAWLAGRRVTWLGPATVRAWATLALPTLGLRVVRRGRPMAEPGVIVANHASWIDIVTLMRVAEPFFVSKAEVRGWPVIGAIGAAIGTVFIDRRPIAAKTQGAALLARLAQGDRLVLFPEGTSSDGQRVLPFKSALFGVVFAAEHRARTHVQPVTIVYRPGPGLPSAFYAWWGEMEFARHLTDVLALSRRGTVEVTFHPPLRVADFADRKALAEAACAAVRAGLRGPA